MFRVDQPPGDRRYRLTNPEGYSLTYNGLVMAVEKRRSHGWQASGPTHCRGRTGCSPRAERPPRARRSRTVAPRPPRSRRVTFGHDPNDLTNARGRLPNDRPHMFRVMGSGRRATDRLRGRRQPPASQRQAVGGNGARSTRRTRSERVLLEPRGTQRLSSQTLLDFRVSRAIRLGGMGRVELRLDVLNALNDTAEESIGTDDVQRADIRSAHDIRRSAPRDAQRAARSRPIAALYKSWRP